MLVTKLLTEAYIILESGGQSTVRRINVLSESTRQSKQAEKQMKCKSDAIRGIAPAGSWMSGSEFPSYGYRIRYNRASTE